MSEPIPSADETGVPAWLRKRRPDITEWVKEGDRRWRGRLPATDFVDGWLLVAFDDQRRQCSRGTPTSGRSGQRAEHE